MRVIEVIDVGWLAGGAERHAQTLRDALVERGHDVLVLATDKNAGGRDVFADIMIPAIAGGAARRLSRYAFYGRAYKALRHAVRTFEPDVIHFHTVGELSPSVLLAAHGVPFIVTVHGPEDFTLALLPWQLPASDYKNHTYQWSDIKVVGRLRYAYLRFLQRPLYLMALRHCAGFVAPSRFMARALTEEAAPELIEQIYNGIELPEQRPATAEPRLLFVGRLEAVKGVDILLRAFARIHHAHPEARLSIIGDGERRSDLEQLADDLGTAGSVRFHGWTAEAEVRAALAASTALVIPSVWPENLPTVALEAIGVGRPIVASRVGGMPELIDEGRTGFLTRPYDVGELASALDALLGDPDLARRMGEAAHVRRELFSVGRLVPTMEDLYQRVSASS
jgi:glycosyltransferase involved in cell wall biosynthesis